jgi:hypothetical protein
VRRSEWGSDVPAKLNRRSLLVTHHPKTQLHLDGLLSQIRATAFSILFAIEGVVETSGCVSVRDDTHHQPRPCIMTDCAPRSCASTVKWGFIPEQAVFAAHHRFRLFMLWYSKATPTKLGQPCTRKQRMSAVALADRPPSLCLLQPSLHLSTAG